MLYKLMKFFFLNFNLVFKILAENQKYSNLVNIDWSALYYISINLTLQALQTDVKLFKFRNHSIFQISYNFLK